MAGKQFLWLGTYNDKFKQLDMQKINDMKKEAKDFHLPAKILFRHAGIFGSTGSGKTVLGKIICEEAARNGIPIIAIDPQGDIASLALESDPEELSQEHGIPRKIFDSYSDKVDVRIYTPASSKGLPISINPINIPEKKLAGKKFDQEDIVKLLDNQSTMLVRVLEKVANLPGSWTSSAEAAIYTVLQSFYEKGEQIENLMELAKIVETRDDLKIEEFLNERQRKKLAISLKTMTVGSTKLLFSSSQNINIDQLLAETSSNDGKKKRTPVNVFFLKSLYSQEEKEFFISVLVNELYSWMIRQGQAKKPRCIFFCDEIAPFIPAGASKPGPKDSMILLFRQARKYGIQCVIASQSPKDVDYHAYEQFNTFFIGRITSRQSLKVIEKLLEGFGKGVIRDSVDAIPVLKTGEFVFVSPDNKIPFAMGFTRWLLTKHRTLTLDDVKAMMAGKYTDVFDDTSDEDAAIDQPPVVPEESGKQASIQVDPPTKHAITKNNPLEERVISPEKSPFQDEVEDIERELDKQDAPEKDLIKQISLAKKQLSRMSETQFKQVIDAPITPTKPSKLPKNFTNRMIMEAIFDRLGKIARSDFGIEFLKDLVTKRALPRNISEMTYFQEYNKVIEMKLAFIEKEKLVFDFETVVEDIITSLGVKDARMDKSSLARLEAIFFKLISTPGLKKRLKI